MLKLDIWRSSGKLFIKQEHSHIDTNKLNTDKNDKSFNNYAINNRENTDKHSLIAEKGNR